MFKKGFNYSNMIHSYLNQGGLQTVNIPSPAPPDNNKADRPKACLVSQKKSNFSFNGKSGDSKMTPIPLVTVETYSSIKYFVP